MTTGTNTQTLSGFLLARIAEDEAAKAADPSIEIGDPLTWGTDCTCNYLPRRRRAVAECEAKRRIVERYATCLEEDERNTADHYAFTAAGGSEFDEPDPALYTPIDRTRVTSPFETAGLAFAVRAIAAVYADHPDYRDEWRQDT